ncbi:MAG TPA: PVC-type heme-binding CxxCH protein [Bryobacteraceae bacterium]|nr:PVC-type heme-binding CxxCH protein [Bryobacteraceae bacterium]
MTRIVIAATLLLAVSCSRKHPDAPALSPEESLKAIHIQGDFHVELFASEPLVYDPVEMAFDENGKIYVAEMLDYPDDPPTGQPARSRIVLLEDTDGDGKPDKRTVFADHVLEVSGLMPWKGGLIVTSAPDIVYMKDTDGDGKADVRQVLYTGFPKVNPEARVTNPRLGIDNWIYVANDGSDGRITSPEHPDRPPVVVRGTDFRFQPERGLAEPASGPTQFGMSFDDWGDRFITQNTIHVRNVVVPMQYLIRAPLLEVSQVSQDISDHGQPSAPMFPLTKPQQWRKERSRIREQRYHENQLERVRGLDPSTEIVAGYFTAAAGGTVYTGDVFPKPYWGNIFTGDVSGNLVHRDVLTPDGVTFVAHRGENNVEFLASTDVWFRPCNFANAPDGNLYITDIYREFIETPESIPEEIKKAMNFWSGVDKGRIYRIVSNHPLRKRDLKPNLGKASTAELVEELSNTNGWNRQTAQRLLVERQDRAAVPLLKQVAQKSDLPQARLHALWTLEGLSALDPQMVIGALRDPDAHVRENALRMAEEFATSPAVVGTALALKNDPAARVEFQLCFTLGQFKDPRALAALTDLARDRAGESWFRTAILSSLNDDASDFFHLYLSRNKFQLNPVFLNGLAALIGAKHDPNEIRRFLAVEEALVPQHPNEGAAGLFGLAKGLQLSGVHDLLVPGAEPKLAHFLDHSSETVQKAAWEIAGHLRLEGLVQRASHDAATASLGADRRAAAVRALRSGQFAAVSPVLRQILSANPPAPAELQTAAVECMAAFNDPQVAPALLADWKSYSPEARKEVIAAMLNQRQRVPVLLKAIEDHEIELAAVDIAARSRLMDDSDRAIAERARHVFQDQSSDRAKVVENYRDVLKMTGDEQRGKKAFETNCARCHLPRKQGGRVGPDLSGVNNKTKEELLTSILNPSYAIEPHYVHYVVTTKDGQIHDGVIANETPGAITLRGGTENGDETILRSNIAEIRASNVSLMPEGLEQSMSRQDIADVIAYLRAGL